MNELEVFVPRQNPTIYDGCEWKILDSHTIFDDGVAQTLWTSQKDPHIFITTDESISVKIIIDNFTNDPKNIARANTVFGVTKHKIEIGDFGNSSVIIEQFISDYPLLFKARLKLYDLYSKDAVLRAVLSEYKRSGKHYIQELRDFGIDYPEFKAIERSAGHK